MARLERIEEYGHFGITNFLGDSLAELKWKNGTRVYFIILRPRKDKTILVLLGGNKNSQVSDIRRARKLIIKYVSEE
jgi:putative addiction module killer protein